jgi:hypothetical protein
MHSLTLVRFGDAGSAMGGGTPRVGRADLGMRLCERGELLASPFRLTDRWGHLLPSTTTSVSIRLRAVPRTGDRSSRVGCDTISRSS